MLEAMREEVMMKAFWETRAKVDHHEKMMEFYEHRANIARNPKVASRLYRKADMARDAAQHYLNLSDKIYWGFEEKEASVSYTCFFF